MRATSCFATRILTIAFRRMLPLLLLCTALFAAGGRSRHQDKRLDAPAAIVHMTATNKFDPETVTIKVGQAVRWVNDGRGPSHTVTTDASMLQDENNVELPDGAKPFSSGVIGPGKFFQHKFEVPGTYRYACAPHEGSKMFGKVVVTQ